MKIQIKNRWNEAVIFETYAEDIGHAVIAAIAAGADLRGTDLRGADLRGANLSAANLSAANLRAANLRGANLRGADLSAANLIGANLRGANLSAANLSAANLIGANLSAADLRGANLSAANLSAANLSAADLRGANLSAANLRAADLRGANLSAADLSAADLSAADLLSLVSQRTIVPEGNIIGWKKLKAGVICKLRIPEEAKRVGGLVGRKCRAAMAVVLEGEGISNYDSKVSYQVGATIIPDSYDPNPIVECSHGIHFFITREEAEAYS